MREGGRERASKGGKEVRKWEGGRKGGTRVAHQLESEGVWLRTRPANRPRSGS